MHPLYSPEDFRHRVMRNAERFRSETVGDHVFNPEFTSDYLEQEHKPAAVLVPVVRRNDDATVLFTKRTENLSSHPGQVAFPGGKIDRSDPSAVAAALRETEEEIGLGPGSVEVIGTAPDYLTGSGYHIVPVLGLVEPDTELVLNEYEVSDVFEVPLSYLMNPDNHIVGSRIWKDHLRIYYEIPYQDRHIWGVTAGLVRILYERLYGELA